MKSGKPYRLLLGVLLFLTCTASAQRRMTYGEYIEKYKALAIEDQEIYGIPASITMAQALLESDCGNSRLAREANNHFGIKCKSDWTGETILHDDDAENECFRKYGSVEESFRDHSEFLDKSPRYQSLFALDLYDYKGWARGLKAAGYATNPRYADQLIKIIEENKLYLLDSGQDKLLAEEIAAKPVEPLIPEIEAEKIDVDNYVISLNTVGDRAVYANNGSEFIVARQGDTYESLSKQAGVSAKRLRKFNDMPEDSQPAAGEPVYIRKKGKRANNGKLIHVVKEGETLHSISQTYGIQLKKLSSMNRREPDSKLSAGQQIRLM